MGPTPQSIQYYKRYSSSSSSLMYVQYVYDNNLRIAAKNTNRFHNEHFYTPDANGLLKEIYYRADVGNPGSFPTGRLSFTRDQSGLIQTVANDLAMTVNYDPDLQISSISHTLPQPFDESYTYDANGNRLTSLSNSFIYDDLNKLTESTTHEYTYDADGNMTQERNKLTGETKKYYWDSENRMIKYEHLASDISPVDSTALYKYDIYGRRIQKDVNGSVINFMWEGDNVSLELDSANQPIRKYFTESHKWVASLDASPSLGIAMRMGMDDYFAHLNYNEVTNWSQVFSDWYPQGWYGYIKDQVGTIYKVWDQSTRTIADNRTYDSFGNLISQAGTTKTPLGFQGKYYDQENGLNYFYHRYYSPAIGRFISEDPIGFEGGLNLFRFVGGNPVKFTDKLGYERDWRDQMPNGGGLRQLNNIEFIALFGGSPSEIIKWTVEGIFSKSSGCCFGKFLNCMVVPDFNDFMSSLDSIFTVWEMTGWIYGPPNAATSLYLGATAIMTEFKWYKFGGTTAKILGGVAAGLSVYSYVDCWLKMKKCMGW